MAKSCKTSRHHSHLYYEQSVKYIVDYSYQSNSKVQFSFQIYYWYFQICWLNKLLEKRTVLTDFKFDVYLFFVHNFLPSPPISMIPFLFERSSFLIFPIFFFNEISVVVFLYSGEMYPPPPQIECYPCTTRMLCRESIVLPFTECDQLIIK